MDRSLEVWYPVAVRYHQILDDNIADLGIPLLEQFDGLVRVSQCSHPPIARTSLVGVMAVVANVGPGSLEPSETITQPRRRSRPQ